MPEPAAAYLLATAILAAAPTAEEIEAARVEKCAVRLAIAFTGHGPAPEFLARPNPQGEVDRLMESEAFIKRFAAFANASFHDEPGLREMEDVPYNLAQHVLRNRLAWRELFAGQWRVDWERLDTGRRAVISPDPNGLGYFRDPYWASRYQGNAEDGVRLQTVYRVMNNTIGLKLTPTNTTAEDKTATGRAKAGCVGCHFNPVFGLDIAAQLYPLARVKNPTPPENVSIVLLGGKTLTSDKDFVTALVESEDFKFNACRLAFNFLYGRDEYACEAPLFDRCMAAFRAEETMQSALRAIAQDSSFCQ